MESVTHSTAEGVKGKTLESFKFKCPQCSLNCKTRKVSTEDGDIEVQGKKYTGGLHVEVEHPKPLCSMFIQTNIADYLRAVQEDIQEKTKRAKKPARKKVRR